MFVRELVVLVVACPCIGARWLKSPAMIRRVVRLSSASRRRALNAISTPPSSAKPSVSVSP